ncbi:MAG TPA: inositol 2-dehydrogenase [Woeseiaceae bacterium]|nr:inositol 2-dehydrogenase [Woeseiaceae bacterium]
MIRLSLFGAGRIGRIHAANAAAHPDAELRFIVDVDARAAEELARATGAQAADAATALAGGVDAVLVASSTDTHLPLIEAAARAGLPVLCEKPLDLDTARARRAVEVAGQAGIPLFVGFNRRYDPGFRRIKDEIAAGAIGRVEVVSITSRDPAPPPLDYVRRSGGLFRDMTIHDLDMARWLLGEEPVSVFASASTLVDPAIGAAGDVDTAVVVLRTASGALCQVTNSRRCAYGYDQRIEVFGAGGMLRADNETATRVERAGADGFLSEPALPFFLERYGEAYRRELADFLAAVAGGSPGPLATGEDGVRALVLAEAAEAARQSGAAAAVG